MSKSKHAIAERDAGAVRAHPTMPNWLMLLIAAACGLIAANLYYAQPLVGLISAAVGLRPEAAGLIVTLTQIGYGAGLLLVVPMGDLVENRRLVLGLLALLLVALGLAMTVSQPLAFLGACLMIGFAAVAVQVLVPYATHMAPEAVRGRVVGNVVSGLLFGIMLARPLASLITHLWSWRTVYAVSAVLMLTLAVVLRILMPVRRPQATATYGVLLRSLGGIMARHAVLRRRALYQAGMFGGFSVFWTVTPLYLSSTRFGLTQKGIALFALVGMAGAIVAPIAGRLADRGKTRSGSAFCMLAGVLAFGLTLLPPINSLLGLTLLVAAAILLDFGVSGNLVLGQRAVYMLGAELRGRVNGLYMATFFLGGAAGSAIGAWSYAHWGWSGAALVGMSMPLAALLYFATEPREAA
jgi:predicted MFS family arabinose efflux permease